MALKTRLHTPNLFASKLQKHPCNQNLLAQPGLKVGGKVSLARTLESVKVLYSGLGYTFPVQSKHNYPYGIEN